MPEIKQVIVVRKDLKMRRGKEIAQGAHASMAWMSLRFRRALDGDLEALRLTSEQQGWIQGSFAKICVRVDSEDALRAVHAKALEAGIDLTRRESRPVVLVLTSLPPSLRREEQVELAPDVHARFLARFEDAIVSDENYTLFLLYDPRRP